eukprot:72013-Pyramimonas_sp.AAC.1
MRQYVILKNCRYRLNESVLDLRTRARVQEVRTFSLPFCDRRLLGVCSLSPSATGARYGYILSRPTLATLTRSHPPNKSRVGAAVLPQSSRCCHDSMPV